MKIIVLETPEFKIDGGAYFGVVPKIIWEKKYPADENNMCKASCRSILIEDGDKLVLVDTGIGEKPDNYTPDIYSTDYSKNLEDNLKSAGYSNDDITDVVLTHLHFDHCGGTTKFSKQTQSYILTFPKANHHISLLQWENAFNPNYREKSSYLKKNFEILDGSTCLNLITENTNITKNIELKLFNGHTPGLMLPVIYTKNRTFFFSGDLIPAKASIPLAWVSAYDLFPLTSIDEKMKILDEAAEKNWVMIFQHDYYCEACELIKTEKGVRGSNNLIIKELFL